ncbi:hypothetical protein CANCADRAFT_44356 [Tortispora caseinolytica NRRL Y-17796]|uniref:C2H2-type domain-containing protein n=1 Tax=Tortispora caseinolytica NRRL Y-17796 TaxID=767744 RepID=A0A1E4TG22_9ASCO|nr:hypothetical protein CANCADRAFT_44356 [Tortispora caseinolytica NRRL Y-17796]
MIFDSIPFISFPSSSPSFSVNDILTALLSVAVLWETLHALLRVFRSYSKQYNSSTKASLFPDQCFIDKRLNETSAGSPVPCAISAPMSYYMAPNQEGDSITWFLDETNNRPNAYEFNLPNGMLTAPQTRTDFQADSNGLNANQSQQIAFEELAATQFQENIALNEPSNNFPAKQAWNARPFVTAPHSIARMQMLQAQGLVLPDSAAVNQDFNQQVTGLEDIDSLSALGFIPTMLDSNPGSLSNSVSSAEDTMKLPFDIASMSQASVSNLSSGCGDSDLDIYLSSMGDGKYLSSNMNLRTSDLSELPSDFHPGKSYPLGGEFTLKENAFTAPPTNANLHIHHSQGHVTASESPTVEDGFTPMDNANAALFDASFAIGKPVSKRGLIVDNILSPSSLNTQTSQEHFARSYSPSYGRQMTNVPHTYNAPNSIVDLRLSAVSNNSLSPIHSSPYSDQESVVSGHSHYSNHSVTSVMGYDHSNDAVREKTFNIKTDVGSGQTRIYSCPYCPSTFKIKGYLTRHLKKHADIMAYTCPYFDKTSNTPCHSTGGFSRRDTYKTHLKSRHFIYPVKAKLKERTDLPGKCAGCHMEFRNASDWFASHVDTGMCSGLKITPDQGNASRRRK